ncbi:MAG: M48 family metalloprotease [Muribaculaceae bacterium]|nr:M48 family metalloprotease [Muribaculaceae bacterium]
MNEGSLTQRYKVRIIGFYSLIVLTLLGWVALSILFALGIVYLGGNDGRFIAVALLPVLYALFALFIFFDYKPRKSKGIRVSRSSAPDLMELIMGTVRDVGFVGCIGDVVLTPGTTVAVYYAPTLYNFIFKSRASLQIGVTLCRVLSKDELRAVIGHELAHYLQPQTKYKAYLARITNISSRLGMHGLLDSGEDYNHVIFGLYALPARLFTYIFKNIYETIFNINSSEYLKVSVEMELEADRISADAIGAEQLLSALCKSIGLSERLILYNALILPYISSFGYRCDGYWKGFEDAASFFRHIDGLDLDSAHKVISLDVQLLDSDESIMSQRLNALRKRLDLSVSSRASQASIDVIPETIVNKFDEFLCEMYGETEGVKIGDIRFNELLDDLKEGLFAEIHSMEEAMSVLKELFDELQRDSLDKPEEEQPEYSGYDVVPQPIVRQPSELIRTSEMGHCPVCGYEVSEETNVCPHCHEIISE